MIDAGGEGAEKCAQILSRQVLRDCHTRKRIVGRGEVCLRLGRCGIGRVYRPVRDTPRRQARNCAVGCDT